MFERGQHADALRRFQALHAETKSPNARLYVARCLLALGKLPEAYVEMRGTLQDAAARAEDEARFAKTREAAAAELASLETRLALVTLVPPTGAPPLEVRINGAAVAGADLGTPLPVRPGEVKVTGTAGGKPLPPLTFPVRAGDKRAVALALPSPDAPVGRAPPATEPVTDPDRSRPSTLRVPAWIAVGVGVAGLGVFGVTQGLAQGEYASLQHDCGPRRCSDPADGARVDRGKAFESASYVGVGVGGAALVTAAVLFAVGTGGKRTEPALMPAVGPRSAALEARWAF